MTEPDVPRLAGVHHVKLPVADLRRSQDWYTATLGYRSALEFHEEGRLMGVALEHPDGGPMFALRLDPQRARAAAGFDYFAIGVPDRAALDALADRLSALGVPHAGVHVATVGWILPLVHDPDGHEVRFYTVEHHTRTDQDAVRVVEDAVGSEEQRLAELDRRAGPRTARSLA